MALPVVIGAAAVIGVIALSRGKSGPEPYKFGWEDGSAYPPKPGQTTTATDGNGGVSQVQNDGLGAVATPTTSGPGDGAPPSQETPGTPLSPSGTVGGLAPGTGPVCAPNAGGGMTCTEPTTQTAPPPSGAMASKSMYTALTGNITGLSPTSADRLLSDVGSKSGVIW